MGPSPYTKIKPIGSGAFGSCFIVSHARTGERLVLKEVKLRGLDAKELKRSVNEAAVLQRLSHPHVIAYHDSRASKEEGLLSIVMEHAAGGDLGSLIEERARSGRRFSEAEVARVAAQCCSALAYCHHTCFLLHRDIKPQNIFLKSAHPAEGGRTPGDVKIGDFGISKSLAMSHALALTKCGSPVYMSPELCAGKPYDRGCDVWALGCVLYEMMLLRTPWVDRIGPRGGMMALMRLVVHGTLDLTPLRGDYSAELCELLASLLAKKPTARPSFRTLLQTPIVRQALTLAPTPTPLISHALQRRNPSACATQPSITATDEAGDANATARAEPCPATVATGLHPLPVVSPPANVKGGCGGLPPPPPNANGRKANGPKGNLFEELTRPGAMPSPFDARRGPRRAPAPTAPSLPPSVRRPSPKSATPSPRETAAAAMRAQAVGGERRMAADQRAHPAGGRENRLLPLPQPRGEPPPVGPEVRPAVGPAVAAARRQGLDVDRPFERALGADAHAAALCLQHSFQIAARRRRAALVRPEAGVRAAGLPARRLGR